MNRFEDSHSEADAEVGAAYRDLAKEHVPRHVDAAVLEMARNSVGSRTGLSRLTAWLRPLTFVATAGLSLALIVQLSNTPDIDLPEDAGTGVAPLSTDIFQDAASQTAEQIRQLEQNPGMSMSTDAPTTAPVAESSREFSLLPANQRCDDEARASSGTWWQCVRELEQRGLPEAAEMELQALLKAFPQFSAPR